MASLTLYHAAPSRSSIAHWMLEEVGQPYDLHVLGLKEGDNRKPAYLKVNPMGKVPALRHGDVVVTEAAAICCYLADAFPQAGLSTRFTASRRRASRSSPAPNSARVAGSGTAARPSSAKSCRITRGAKTKLSTVS
jgi:glutathione S-transferase